MGEWSSNKINGSGDVFDKHGTKIGTFKSSPDGDGFFFDDESVDNRDRNFYYNDQSGCYFDHPNPKEAHYQVCLSCQGYTTPPESKCYDWKWKEYGRGNLTDPWPHDHTANGRLHRTSL